MVKIKRIISIVELVDGKTTNFKITCFPQANSIELTNCDIYYLLNFLRLKNEKRRVD